MLATVISIDVGTVICVGLIIAVTLLVKPR